MVRLPDGENILRLFSGVDRILACDGQTDRQTSCDGIVRAMHTCRTVIKRTERLKRWGHSFDCFRLLKL